MKPIWWRLRLPAHHSPLAPAIWLLAGYLIQRFAFRNPEPTLAVVFATSLSASMLLFSLVALLTFHVRTIIPVRLVA